MVDSPRCSGRIEKGRVEKEGLDRDVKQGLNSCVRLSDALDGLTRSVSLLVVSVNKGSRDRPAVAFDASPPRPIETRGAKSPAASTRRIQPLADKPRSRFGGSRLRSCGDRFCDQAPRIYGAKQLGRVQEFEPRLRGMSLEDRRGLFLITLSRKLILPDLGLLC